MEQQYKELIEFHKNRIADLVGNLVKPNFTVKNMESFGNIFLLVKYEENNEILSQAQGILERENYQANFPLNFKKSIEKTHSLLTTQIIIKH